jgi:hypothetical protein
VRGLTLRAVTIAFCLLLLFAPAAFYGELVYSTTYAFATGVPAMAPLVVLFVLTALNWVPRRLGLRALTRRELLAIYGIVLVGGPLVSHSILAWMLPFNALQQYLGWMFPEWQEAYFHLIPQWFTPTSIATLEGMFHGQAAVPWHQWWLPLLAWSSYVVALFLGSLFLVVLFLRQWVTHERLSFPLAQVPLETVQSGPGSDAGRLPGNWKFWVGFTVPVAIGLLNGLRRYFPALPTVPLQGVTLAPAQPTGPLAGVGTIWLDIDFTLIALAFLIPKELSFSCWFFWFVRVGLTVAAIAAGAAPLAPAGRSTSAFPAPPYQGGGAVLALAVWVLWSGRHYLARAVRLALGGRAQESDAREPMTYRWSLIGFLLCVAYLIWFGTKMGARPIVGLVMMGLIVAFYVIWARLRAETGLGFLAFPLRVNVLMLVPGSALLRPAELFAVMSLRWSYSPGFGETLEVCTGNGMEALKIADAAHLPLRPVLRALIAGFLLSLGVGIYAMVTGMYRIGFFSMRAATEHGWLGPQLRYMGDYIYETITTAAPPDVNGMIAIGAGVAVTVLLVVLRMQFWWWPLHPVGYLAANCWGMQYYWMALFIGWAWKSLTIRYGGLKLYRALVPLAIGLLVGNMVVQGIWVAVNSLMRQPV